MAEYKLRVEVSSNKSGGLTMREWLGLSRGRLLLPFLCCLACCILPASTTGNGDIWPLERPDGMPSIQSLEVMCGKDHMDVHLSFSHPFEGIVSSKGQHGDPRCVYVPPSTGQTFFSFRIAYARCGTKPDLHGQFYENTVVVQYDRDLLEVWDEAKRLRCEWFNDYEKTASKPPMVIADLDVIQLDFRGDNVDCWMEIQHGKGPWAPPVSGIVPLGSTLTLVVAINDYRGEFDMRVKSCAASDGGGHIIHLSDEFGCVLRPKMISRFLKARAADERASVITYAFFHAFKFPDALSVHIKCKVEICRHGCLDHCQEHGAGLGASGLDHGHSHYGNLERKDQASQSPVHRHDTTEEGDLLYDDIVQEGDEMAAIGIGHFNTVRQPQVQMPSPQNNKLHNKHKEQLFYGPDHDDSEILPPQPFIDKSSQDRFPHGPRHLDGDPPVAAPRSMNTDELPVVGTPKPQEEPETVTPLPSPPTTSSSSTKRRRRAVVVSDRKVRSADVGVSGLYEVISEADLAFSPDGRAEAVTVFQGRIREEVVYGICLPVPGFSVLFVLVAVSAVVSALVAGSLLYRYQLQREQMAQHSGLIAMNSLASWVGLRLQRGRTQPQNGTDTNSNNPKPSTSGHSNSKKHDSSRDD